MNLHLFQQGATKEARRLVLNIIGSQKQAPTVHEIFKLAVQQESGGSPSKPESSSQAAAPGHPPQPRYPDHAIRSMSYLKGVVLPSLVQTKDIEKIHTLQELTPEEQAQRLQTLSRSARKQAASLSTAVDVWRWQLRAHKPTPPKPKVEIVYGKDVGVGVDWSHLNKRRQRSRALSVTRDVRWLRKLDRAREEGLKAETAEGETKADV